MGMRSSDPAMWTDEVWRPALKKYGGVTRLTVALYDADGRLACGPVNPTPLFDVFAEPEHDLGLFAECAERCLHPIERSGAIVVANRLGIAAVGTALAPDGITVGVAVAGYHLSAFPQTIAIERLASEVRVPAARLWDVVRQEAPLSMSRIVGHGELLQMLAETVLREHDRARQHMDLSARLQAADAAKDEFLAMVSHELRGPLNAILGWTRLLRTEQLKESAQAHALETIERNAWAQTQLVEDLLDVSQIVAGRREIDRRAVVLAAIVDAAVASVSPSAHAKKVRLDVQLHDDGSVVTGDPAQLQRVVMNLISNAIKFTPPGGDVGVKLFHDDVHATLTVTDSGEGIKPEFLPHIFEPFRQQDASSTRVHGGIGLGLTIVRHLVALHGGTIRAESSGVGRGATFTAILPLAIGEPPPASTAARGSAGRMTLPTFSRSICVLVVDDDRDARELLRAVLERAGADVTAVASAGEALAVIDRTQPDVLVGDIGLPEQDGYALVRQIRMRPSEEGGRMPAIAVSAYASAADRQRAASAGYDRHLPKPVDALELIGTIESIAISASH